MRNKYSNQMRRSNSIGVADCVLFVQLAEQKAALEMRESAKKAVDRPTDSFLQRAEAWEKQKRLRAFAAHQRDPVGPRSDENQQPREDKQSVSKKARSGGRVRQQPRQTLRF